MVQKKANPVPKNKKYSTKAQKGMKAGTEAKLSKKSLEHNVVHVKARNCSKNGKEPKAFKTELKKLYN